MYIFPTLQNTVHVAITPAEYFTYRPVYKTVLDDTQYTVLAAPW